MRLALAVALSLMVICSGCGKSGPKKITGPEVVQAFAKSGLDLHDLFAGSTLGGPESYMYLDPNPLNTSNAVLVDIDVFASIQQAQQAQAAGDARATRVANLEITINTGDRTLRRKVATAVARLRERAKGLSS